MADKPTVKDLESGKRGRKPNIDEQRVIDFAFEQLRIYWGPDIWGHGPDFEPSTRKEGSEEVYVRRHWFRYKGQSTDAPYHIRGGSIRLVDRSDMDVALGWSHGARIWGTNTERWYQDRGGHSKLEEELLGFVSLHYPDIYTVLGPKEVPRPDIYVEETPQDDGPTRKNLWFVVGKEVRDKFVVLTDTEAGKGKLSWGFRKPTLRIFLDDMTKVGKFLGEVTNPGGVLGNALANAAQGNSLLAALKAIGGKLTKAEDTLRGLIDDIGEEGLEKLADALVDAGLDERVEPERILKIALLLADLPSESA